VDGVDAPPNYSVRIDLANAAPGRVRVLNMLYQSSTLVVRARSPRRVVEGLVAYLSAYADSGQGLLTRAAALVHVDGTALLVPRDLLARLEILEPRLKRHGLRFVDRLIVAIDPTTAELVVSPRLVEVDASELLPEAAGGDLPTVAPGRYPIAAWALSQGPGIEGPMSKAASVAAASRSVLGMTSRPQWALESLASIIRRAPGIAIRADDSVALAARLASLIPGRP